MACTNGSGVGVGQVIAVGGRSPGKVQRALMGKKRLGSWGAERTIEVTMPPPRLFILFTPLGLMRVAERRQRGHSTELTEAIRLEGR